MEKLPNLEDIKERQEKEAANKEKLERLRSEIVSAAAHLLAEEYASELSSKGIFRGHEDTDYHQRVKKQMNAIQSGLGHFFDQHSDMILSAPNSAEALVEFYKQQKEKLEAEN